MNVSLKEKMADVFDIVKKGTISGLKIVALAVMAALALCGAAVIALGVVALCIFGSLLIPAMLGAGVIWFAWTYMGIGAMYFAQLDPQWLNIPYWHFVATYAVILLVVRLIMRRPPIGNVSNALNKVNEKMKRSKPRSA